MGVPVITAPCEAEAQCAELAKKKKVYATATEDMDALTFRTPKLVRRLTFSQGGGSKDKQQPILELDLETVLAGLELTYEQFVDLCILCGCDYCSTIKGVGPKTVTSRDYRTSSLPLSSVLLLLSRHWSSSSSTKTSRESLPRWRRRRSSTFLRTGCPCG